MYEKFVVVKLWGIISFAFSEQTNLISGCNNYMFYFRSYETDFVLNLVWKIHAKNS